MALALHHRIPTGRLAQFVSSLWVSEGMPPEHRLERVLPYGNASLILNLAEDRIWTYERESGAVAEGLGGVIVAGPRSRYEVIDTECQKMLAGVTLRPEGAAMLLGAPAGELTDLDVPLDAVWGRAARRWRERVMEARTAEARLAALEVGLTERLPDEGPPRVVLYGVRNWGREEERRGWPRWRKRQGYRNGGSLSCSGGMWGWGRRCINEFSGFSGLCGWRMRGGG